MAKDMSFGGDINNNKASASQESAFDISDLYQNEESIDISSYMTSANLELCDDDLFQSLFPSTAEADTTTVKSEKPDPFEAELDWWHEPGSAYSSACSSAAPSPVQFFNTPPVTPKADRGNEASPESFQKQLQQQDRLGQYSMSRTQLTLSEDAVSAITSNKDNIISIKADPDAPQMYFITNHDGENKSKSQIADLVRIAPGNPRSYDEYNESLYGNPTPVKDVAKTEFYGKRQITTPEESSKPAKRSKPIPKDSEEYKMKRERNNIAVRKSRDKAKIKSQETQNKVSELSNENKRLHDRVAELTHELNTLKGILKSLPQQQRMAN